MYLSNNLYEYRFLEVNILELHSGENGYFANNEIGNTKVEKVKIIDINSELKNCFCVKVGIYILNKKVISEENNEEK